MNELNEINEETFDEDLFALEPLQSEHNSRESGRPSILSITRTLKSGNRGAISHKVIEAIGAETEVYISAYRHGVAIDSTPSDVSKRFTLRKTGNKYMVYSRPLVEELTTRFGLEFGAKTTVSFYEVTYRNGVAYIPLKG